MPRSRPISPALRNANNSRLEPQTIEGAGRLIRSTSDKGVVAVFDPRMAKANYRWDFVNSLPPMKRTKDRAEVEEFLKALNKES